MFGQKLRQQRIEGAITDQAAQTMALHKPGDVIDAGAPQQVLSHFNSTSRLARWAIIALGADEMDKIRQMGQKYDYKVVGKSLVKTDARGNSTSPEAAETEGHKPAEVATMDWMVKKRRCQGRSTCRASRPIRTFMSKLELGLAAYQGYQARDRQIKAEGYQDRQPEYGTAQMDANQVAVETAELACKLGQYRMALLPRSIKLGKPEAAESEISLGQP